MFLHLVLEPFRAVLRGVTATPSSGSEENLIREALQSFQMQNSQMGQLMLQVNQSLQELSRGQSQMLVMFQPPAVEGNLDQLMEDNQWSDVEELELPVQNPNQEQAQD